MAWPTKVSPTCRGNHTAPVFFSDTDREVYLAMLLESCRSFKLDVWAYCLMTNHVHLIAVPRERASMAGAIGRCHMRYSRWINKQRAWTGHLWANRYHSSLLGDEHLWNAVRYVEQNPVRARMVAKCEEWPWSSTRPCTACASGCVIKQYHAVPRQRDRLA